ncbi:haloalkane dehalogenase [Gammaproteobacteria bacterium]|nr:alpha/beta fold hydrolase [SAR86 cluster bacterium]MDB3880619.1 haloalkane dehalogenase [Gammaproteobacteria bacterium]MDC0865408.1 haloalkane dehalogenase [bacterium]MDC3323746.1 haloalkane dehalogenase [Gammaproteobacteria bacterium]
MNKIKVLTFLTISLLSFLSFSYEVKEGVLRTPDDRFENLENYPFKPNYMMIDGLRIHYLDEGPNDADPIILFHGEPTWSYLFRKMIPVLTEAGYRVVVPDMVGFGKSDKFESKYDYSYQHHIEVMKELIKRLDLKNATHFGQDWGGLVGLRVVAEMPNRFSQVVVSNTGMVSREGISAWFMQRLVELTVWWNGPITYKELILAAQESLNTDSPTPSSATSMFSKWMAYSYYSEDMDIVGIIENFGQLNLSEEEKRAYEAPYPSGKYKAGAHVWPYLIPTQLQENEKYWKEVYEEWDKPFLVAFGSEERITIRMKDDFLNRIPNPTVITLDGVGHFVQEEMGPELAQIIINFIEGKKVSDLI